jgi:SAM-dependent methyltransferase
MGNKELTEQNFWEDYWKTRGESIIEVKRTKKGLSINAILDAFDKFLKPDENATILEIGGAPGQYLVYMARNFKYKVSSLDYSRVGNEQTIRNMKACGIDVNVFEKDILAEDFKNGLPLFDIVYSLGFVEHFEDLNLVVKRHLELLKPGGTLIIGVPNLTGIYRLFLKKTAPGHLAIHNLTSMYEKRWDSFEKEYNLTRLYRSYIGGFEPLVMKKLEKKNPVNLFLNFIVKGLTVVFSFQFNFLRKFNSRFWSGYLIGVYKKN